MKEDKAVGGRVHGDVYGETEVSTRPGDSRLGTWTLYGADRRQASSTPRPSPSPPVLHDPCFPLPPPCRRPLP